MTRILTIDGNSFARRYYEASGSIYSPFIELVRKLQSEFSPEMVFVAWDHARSREFRQAMDPEYKAKRSPTPPAFLDQVKNLQSALPWFGITQHTCEAEADDAIATIAFTYPGPHMIVTGDKDLLQLVRPTISVLRDKLYTDIDHVKQLGFQCLAGDPVDGVPGIKGIGEKTANKILDVCPDFVELVIDGNEDQARQMVAASDASIVKWCEKVIMNRDQLELTKRLVTLYVMPLTTVEEDEDLDKLNEWLMSNDLGHLL